MGLDIVQWWPTDGLWQFHAQHTRWTEIAEHCYSVRLNNIRQGKAGPFNAGEWQKQMHGLSTLRHINKYITKAFNGFVDVHARASWCSLLFHMRVLYSASVCIRSPCQSFVFFADYGFCIYLLVPFLFFLLDV